MAAVVGAAPEQARARLGRDLARALRAVDKFGNSHLAAADDPAFPDHQQLRLAAGEDPALAAYAVLDEQWRRRDFYLFDLSDSYWISEYSWRGQPARGERQRLVIARALTQQPKAMLLVEPTANLDINHQVEILNLVRSLCLEQSLTVIIALHDLNLAAQYCDWMVMLNGGRVYAEGTPLNILTAPNIKNVYGAEVCVYPHPVNGLPTTLVTAGRSHGPS